MQKVSKKIIVLERVDSTNNYAMALVQKGEAADGTGIFARDQTEGKGRRGKYWESGIDENIILSIIKQMQWLQVNEQFQLSVATALGCIDFFSKYIREDLKIKWPNDIFINDSKAGGILIENQLKGNLWQWAVIGIGLNINQVNFNNEKSNAISLKQITGVKYNVIGMAHELYNCINERINALQQNQFSSMLHEYNQNLYARNKIVKLKKQNEIFETKIESVSSSGELLTRDDVERKFRFDEVEWIYAHH